jgi:hypothetical protein
MSDLERTTILTASLFVMGAVASLPAVLTDFPLNMMFFAIMLGLVYLIAMIHQPDPEPPEVIVLLIETAGLWAGFAATFHLIHRVGDYEGLWIGLAGFIVSFLALLPCTRKRQNTGE